jgi:hypothetical protein
MTEFEDPLGPLDPNFAENFRRDMRLPDARGNRRRASCIWCRR